MPVADADGDGLVSVDDIVRNFRSHAHLEVVDGSRIEEDVRREFLESFSGEQATQRERGGGTSACNLVKGLANSRRECIASSRRPGTACFLVDFFVPRHCIRGTHFLRIMSTYAAPDTETEGEREQE